MRSIGLCRAPVEKTFCHSRLLLIPRRKECPVQKSPNPLLQLSVHWLEVSSDTVHTHGKVPIKLKRLLLLG